MHPEPELDEHRELARTVHRIFASCASECDADDDNTAFAVTLRGRLADLGIWGIGVPESLGGSGGGLTDLAVVAGEIGRTLAPVACTANCVAVAMLTAAGGHEGLVREMASGGQVALAVTQPGWTRPGANPIDVECVPNGGSVAVSGTASGVLDAGHASHVVVIPPRHVPPVLIVIDGPGVAVEACTSLAGAHDVRRLRFDGVAGQPLEIEGSVVSDAVASGRVLLTFEMLGAIDAVFALTLEHALARQQFGQPIGSFQAVAHRLADAHVRRHQAAVSAVYALRVHGSEHFALAAAVARDVASRALITATHQAIQIHGALSFTWEHPLHRYVKYARVAERLLASPGGHLADLLDVSRCP